MRWLPSAFLAASQVLVLDPQDPASHLQLAWGRYAAQDLETEPGVERLPALKSSLDEVGRAWSAWALAGLQRGTSPPRLVLPRLVVAEPATRSGGPSPATPARMKVAGRWGPSDPALPLELPVPCGAAASWPCSHRGAAGWEIRLLDLSNSAGPSDPLGARDNAQALLLSGPRVVVASTPPWCLLEPDRRAGLASRSGGRSPARAVLRGRRLPLRRPLCVQAGAGGAGGPPPGLFRPRRSRRGSSARPADSSRSTRWAQAQWAPGSPSRSRPRASARGRPGPRAEPPDRPQRRASPVRAGP